ncbi:MAG: histidinol-phosphatase [Firmicutes bacterium]|nr:histidinol-phosphatase [Bacillota bacterium]
MYKQNLHTHTYFCDGRSTPEDMIKEALNRGFDSIGFSGHAYTPFDVSWCMPREMTPKYYAECRMLAERYRGKIDVYTGVEQDIFSEKSELPFDFRIGSVHYLSENSDAAIDESPEMLLSAAEKYYAGDMMALIREYYSLVETLPEATGCDIIGHFDLVTKFIERVPALFDVDGDEYLDIALSAAKSLVEKRVIFEINSGAMSRGYRSEPYPARNILTELAKMDAKITFSSDCHAKWSLDFGFDEMASLAVECGFDHIYVMKYGAFVREKIG